MHKRPSVKAPWLAAVVIFLATFAVAGLGGWATSASVGTWYQTISKPSWTPPDWIFGPVWTALYALMALAAFLVWRTGDWPTIPLPLCLYAVQLALNLAWSLIFFGLRSPGLAAIEIIVLWVAIGATLMSFWRRSRLAGLMLAPYWAWVTFAAVLNIAIWRLNTA
jgi:tryptophan-rich sensory protein